jgi:hypothetical protein
MTLVDLKHAIVVHLESMSPKTRWVNNGMEVYLDPMRWTVLEYSEDDGNPDGTDDKNIRVYGINGASTDGKFSGHVRVVTDHSDDEIKLIEAVLPKGKLTAGQHDFVSLARGEAKWLMDQAEPKPTNPDFGSW